MSRENTLTAGQRIGNAYRGAAGLPERKNDKPGDVSDVSELSRATEPEKGYGGKDGIANSGVLTPSEQATLDRAEATKKAATKKATAKKATTKKATTKKAAAK